jgi:hypothetical protein
VISRWCRFVFVARGRRASFPASRSLLAAPTASPTPQDKNVLQLDATPPRGYSHTHPTNQHERSEDSPSSRSRRSCDFATRIWWPFPRENATAFLTFLPLRALLLGQRRAPARPPPRACPRPCFFNTKWNRSTELQNKSAVIDHLGIRSGRARANKRKSKANCFLTPKRARNCCSRSPRARDGWRSSNITATTTPHPCRRLTTTAPPPQH